MTEQKSAIIKRCRELGIDQHGLGSIRNFIRAANYHKSLEGTLPGDVAVAYNDAIRRATGRILCRGRPGSGRSESRLLSRAAAELRQTILDNPDIEDRKKFAEWRKQVTEEHQDPVDAVQRWIEATSPEVDDVVLRLLTHPPVIITCRENELIHPRFRKAGSPAERYKHIVPTLVEEGTFDFFRTRLKHSRPRRTSKFHVPELAFEL